MSDETIIPPPPHPVEPVESSPEVRIAAQSVWQAIGAVLVTVILIWMVFKARSLVSMLVLSFFFSLALQPIVNRLHVRRGWRRGSAVGVVYLAGAAFTLFLIAVLIPAVAELASAIGANAQVWIGNLSDWLSDTFGWSSADLSQVGEGTQEAAAQVEGWATNAFGTILGIASAGIGLIFSLATIAMFTFYMTAEAPRIQRSFLSLLNSAEAQQRVGWTWDEAVRQTGGYFYSRAILMLINGTGFFFTMVAIGLPTNLALGLAVFAGFVSEFIPAVGTYIGGAVPIFVALAIEGLAPALVLLAYVLVYQQVENYWLSPKISANTMSLNGGVAFGAALAGGALAGPMGAFMALPVAALITSFMSTYASHHEVTYRSPYDDEYPPPDEASDELVENG